MIENLKDICATLARSPVTVQEVAAGLGTLIADQGGNLPLIVRPRFPAFARGTVTRQYGTQWTAGVILSLSASAKLNVRALRAAFGDYAPLPRNLGDSAPSIRFYLGEPAEIGSTSIIATLMPGEWENIEDGTVSELTLQPEF